MMSNFMRLLLDLSKKKPPLSKKEQNNLKTIEDLPINDNIQKEKDYSNKSGNVSKKTEI